jgi:hypothetical protein
MASSTEAGGATAARELARHILAQGRYHASPVPHPLSGFLRTVGRLIEAPLTAVEELVGTISVGTPGGSATVWGVLAALLLASGGVVALRSARRSLAVPSAGAGVLGALAAMDAAQLLRAAGAAEREGRNADAVRLHFRRGLIALIESERVTVAPAMFNGEVSRALRSAQFDTLARTFEEVAYGGRTADAHDVEDARQGWSALLRSVGR